MRSHLSIILAIPLIVSMVGCGSSSNPTDDSMSENINSSLLRLKQITLTNVGFPDLTIDTEYTEDGHIFLQTFRSEGQITRTRAFTTTATGLLTRRGDDIDQDGIEDFVTQYVYNSSSNLSRIERLGSNGLIERIEIYAFQDGLAISREVRDIDDVATSDSVDISSGTIEGIRAFGYEEGRLVSINIDTVGDGVFDQREDYSYNPNGTLATTSLNSVIDGVIGANSFVYEQGACKSWGDTSAAYFCVSPN